MDDFISRPNTCSETYYADTQFGYSFAFPDFKAIEGWKLQFYLIKHQLSFEIESRKTSRVKADTE